jgi:hypothetical protein
MLEYGYQILQKLSFDKALFHKELKKLVFYLTPDEIKQLENWLKKNYYTEYTQSGLFC